MQHMQNWRMHARARARMRWGGGGLEPISAGPCVAVVRVCRSHRISALASWQWYEQDFLIDHLDDLWKDFLRYTSALQQVSTVR